MANSAPRAINDYLEQLRSALSGEDPALIQDALYDAEEYLRAEVAAHPQKSEADVLELIASTYGAPEEVADAYRQTEVKLREAMQTPQRKPATQRSALGRFFAIYRDPRAYTSLFFMLLTLATGIIYFTITTVGLSLSAGLAILIIGIPFFLTFIGITRVISLGEGRLLEAVTGERMPRRPLHPGPRRSLWARIAEMLRDARTWTTILYFLLMLPAGIAYFTIAVTGIAVGASFVAMPFALIAQRLGWFGSGQGIGVFIDGERVAAIEPSWLDSPLGWLLLLVAGIAVLTLLLHFARAVVRKHAQVAKALLVTSL
ncbi:MAG: sensor domain-containing protein [Steroidobacteraceae bacterium]